MAKYNPSPPCPRPRPLGDRAFPPSLPRPGGRQSTAWQVAPARRVQMETLPSDGPHGSVSAAAASVRRLAPTCHTHKDTRPSSSFSRREFDHIERNVHAAHNPRAGARRCGLEAPQLSPGHGRLQASPVSDVPNQRRRGPRATTLPLLKVRAAEYPSAVSGGLVGARSPQPGPRTRELLCVRR